MSDRRSRTRTRLMVFSNATQRHLVVAVDHAAMAPRVNAPGEVIHA